LRKRYYGIILLLLIALSGVSGYLLALAQHSSSDVESNPLGRSEVHYIITNEQGQGTSLKTIVVTGLGEVATKPSLAELRLGASTQAPTATEALANNAEVMNRVIEALKSMNLPEEDIETSRFNLSPRYSSYGGTLIGFEVTHLLRVTTTDLDRVGRVIDEAVDAGANKIEMVCFTVAKDELEGLNTLARQRAVEDARTKAGTIADSLGVKIVGVAGAVEEAYTPYRGYYGVESTIGATPIMPPTELQITVAVKVTFMIEG
jgi:hypothetical protein